MTSFNSSSNIAQMMNFQQAAAQLKLTNLTLQEIANKYNFQPVRIIRIRNTNKVQRINLEPSDADYGDKIRRFVIDKALKTPYKATYYLNARKLYKGKWTNVNIPMQIQGTFKNISKNARDQYDVLRAQYEQKYPEWEFDEFDAQPDDELIPIELGRGIPVTQNVVESTSNGGQRIVMSKGHKAHLKMKHALYMKINDEDDSWNLHQGTCVFDYLFWYYQKQDGFKKDFKTREKAYEIMNRLFQGYDLQNPLEYGVSICQLESFCDKYGVSMYTYDKSCEEIIQYHPKNFLDGKKKQAKPLMFICFDGHFYPIPQNKRNSFVKKTLAKIKSASIETKKQKNDDDDEEIENTKEIIAPTKEEYEELKAYIKDNNLKMNAKNCMAFKMIKQNDFKIPFPINKNNLVVDDNQIQKLVYNDKIIMTEPIDERVKKFYEDNGIVYQGQSFTNVLNEIWEQMYGFNLYNAPFLSNPNFEVYKALTESKVKWRTHLGLTEAGLQQKSNIKQMLKSGEAIAVDICKCYCDCLYNPLENFIVFKGKEQIQIYDEKPLTLGLYFVETDDISLFHKSNWYSKMIILKAAEENIDFKITHQIRCVEDWGYEAENGSSMTANTIFKRYIDKVIELTEDNLSLTKDIINANTGFLGKTSSKQKQPSLGFNLEEVYEDWVVETVSKNPQAKTFILPLKGIESDEKMYMYGFETKVENMTNAVPMYIQILDWSNIHLYNMTKRIGGTLLYRKTDMIISMGGKLQKKYTIQKNSSYKDTFGKYRFENDAIEASYKETDYSIRAAAKPISQNEWKCCNFNDSNDWESILKTAIKKNGMCIIGRAGTGKSYIIEQGVKNGYLPENPKARLAFTNKAARNINGLTIHKAFGLNENEKTNHNSIVSTYLASKIMIDGVEKHILVVDEISLICNELWNILMLLKSKFPETSFILIGDERQCPAIENGKEIDYFNHSYPKHLTGCNKCELTVAKRYDMKLWNWLEIFYNYQADGDDIQKKSLKIEDILDAKNICYFNETRKHINKMCMEKMIETKENILLELPQKIDPKKFEKSQNTYIYEDLPVMAIVSNKALNIINSDEFVVKSFDVENERILLQGDDGELTITFDEFHKYFVVNYAITTHKSQGATYTQKVNIFDWEVLSIKPKLGYTAVSRAKNCEQITINV